MKLFKPKSPVQVVPEDGQLVHFRFASDTTKLPTALPELAVSVKRVQHELISLRAVVASGNGRRAVGVIMEEISLTKGLMEIDRAAREKAQAQCRAGLIAEKEILPSLHKEEETRSAWSALNMELSAAVLANEAAASLSSLLAEIQ
jgi:hypothetical protein